MCGTVMRGADALPGSKATSRAKGSHRKLGDLGSDRNGVCRCRPASGRRGAVADDARTREVGPRHSSCEADEQSGRSDRRELAAEPVERRAGTKGNAGQQSTRRTQSRESVSQALERIRQAARQRKKEKFTALFHHISIDLLEEAFFELKANAAPGVDRLTWKDYEADLERNLEDLHDRVQRGAYRALPSRRVYIPKPDGRQRPLAVAALEDKIVQRATAALLNAIYEEDFLGFSYGFRPGRGTHDALDALCVGITQQEGELHTGRRHPVVLRRGQPGMADPLRGASDRRPAHHPPDPEMAQGGRPGRRGRDGQ